MNPPLQGGELSTLSLTQGFTLGWLKPSLQDEEYDTINPLFTA
jgi:hypothetical protein